MSGSASGPFLEASVESFLGLVSSAEPAPAGGSVAALTVSLAAGLCVKAARLSAEQLPDAAEVAATAERLRDRAGALCQADAEAYGLVMSALRRAREPDAADRQREIVAALSVASDVPLEVVQIASRVAALGARLAEDGNPNLLGDAVTAVLLADSGARSAAALVSINLERSEDDDRIAQAKVLLEEAAAQADRARRRLEG